MSQPRVPTFEDIQAACEISQYLHDHGKKEEATLVLLIINEWSIAAGFAQGVLQMHEIGKAGAGK